MMRGGAGGGGGGWPGAGEWGGLVCPCPQTRVELAAGTVAAPDKLFPSTSPRSAAWSTCCINVIADLSPLPQTNQ